MKIPHGIGKDPNVQRNRHGVTLVEEQFCQSYLLDFCVSKASRRAGISSARGHAMMARQRVRDRIHKIRMETGRAFDVTREALLQELMKIVYADPRDIEGEDGQRLSPRQWSDDYAASVAEIEYDLIGDIKKVKRYDKTKAIELLSRMLGFNAPETSVVKNLNFNTEPMDRDDVLAISKQLEDNL